MDTEYILKRNAVEEYFHVFYGIDRHARFTNIAHNPFVVGVVPAVGWQVKRQRRVLSGPAARFFL